MLNKHVYRWSKNHWTETRDKRYTQLTEFSGRNPTIGSPIILPVSTTVHRKLSGPMFDLDSIEDILLPHATEYLRLRNDVEKKRTLEKQIVGQIKKERPDWIIPKAARKVSTTYHAYAMSHTC